MKYLARITIIAILLAALSVTFIAAQDDAETTEMVGSLVQTAASGTLENNGDDTFTLTLVDVSAITTWVINTPAFRAGLKDTDIFAEEWTYVPEMIGTGILALDEARLGVTLTNPVFDDETNSLAYTVTVDLEQMQVWDVDAWVMTDDDKLLDDLAEFDRASLTIYLDAEFAEAWTVGTEARIAGTRAANNACSPQPC